MNSLISVELFYLYIEFVIYLILCTCLLMEEIFTESNTIILQLADSKVSITILTKPILTLSDGFRYCFLLLFTPVVSTKKEYN